MKSKTECIDEMLTLEDPQSSSDFSHAEGEVLQTR
jgi:hypothetical protein